MTPTIVSFASFKRQYPTGTMLEYIGTDAVCLVLLYLKAPDLCRFSMINKVYHRFISTNDKIWKEVYSAVYHLSGSPRTMPEVGHGAGFTTPTWRQAAVYDHGFVPDTPLQRIRDHTDEVWVVAWSPDGRMAASAGSDGQLLVWKLVRKGQRNEQRLRLERHTQWQYTSPVVGIDWSPDCRYLAVTTKEVLVMVFDIKAKAPLMSNKQLCTTYDCYAKFISNTQIVAGAQTVMLYHDIGVQELRTCTLPVANSGTAVRNHTGSYQVWLRNLNYIGHCPVLIRPCPPPEEVRSCLVSNILPNTTKPQYPYDQDSSHESEEQEQPYPWVKREMEQRKQQEEAWKSANEEDENIEGGNYYCETDAFYFYTCGTRFHHIAMFPIGDLPLPAQRQNCASSSSSSTSASTSEEGDKTKPADQNKDVPPNCLPGTLGDACAAMLGPRFGVSVRAAQRRLRRQREEEAQEERDQQPEPEEVVSSRSCFRNTGMWAGNPQNTLDYFEVRPDTGNSEPICLTETGANLPLPQPGLIPQAYVQPFVWRENGTVLGLTGSPNRRYLLANVRLWVDLLPEYEDEKGGEADLEWTMEARRVPFFPPDSTEYDENWAQWDIQERPMSEINEVHLWNLETGKMERTFRGVTSTKDLFLSWGGFSHLSPHVGCGSADGNIWIWQLNHESMVVRLMKSHSKLVNMVAWHPVLEGVILTGSDDATVVLWGRKDLEMRHTNDPWWNSLPGDPPQYDELRAQDETIPPTSRAEDEARRVSPYNSEMYSDEDFW
eukprot:TRINITY_DN58533_c0_g4_i1.p1 TRINITY_DN58533_c0_g4~~TRINITY_DN58533_c0_g4_i1.p1  ORF type:complete len:772 (+),score=37.75 TRINITY_DN58533_c0_g4_i1:77-2392(+)